MLQAVVNFLSCSRGPGKRGHIVAETLLFMTFPCVRKLGNICCGHKMFLNKILNVFCVPDTNFVSAIACNAGVFWRARLRVWSSERHLGFKLGRGLERDKKASQGVGIMLKGEVTYFAQANMALNLLLRAPKRKRLHCRLCPQQMLRARANGATFVSTTMCPQQCVLVCQGLKKRSFPFTGSLWFHDIV